MARKKKTTVTKTTRKSTKVTAPRGRRFASEDAPKFDPRKHIKLSDLAKKCKISYQSMYLKQKRSNIKALATNHNGVEVIAFTLADAKKIEKDKAQPMRKDSVPIKDIEEKYNVSRPKLTNVLLKLRISPVKRQGQNNRQTLTVTRSESKKIAKELSA